MNKAYNEDEVAWWGVKDKGGIIQKRLKSREKAEKAAGVWQRNGFPNATLAAFDFSHKELPIPPKLKKVGIRKRR